MIDSKEIEKISAEAGELRAFRARKYVREKRINVKCIKENEDGSHTIEANVKGSYDNRYDVIINEYNGKIVEYSCNCMDESKLCKHILATIYEIYNKYNDLIRVDDDTFKYKEFTQLINCFSKGEEKLTNIYFNDDNSYLDHLKKLKEKSIYNIDINLTNTKTLILQTCLNNKTILIISAIKIGEANEKDNFIF